MNDEKWNAFAMSGKIEDYMKYKGSSPDVFYNDATESELNWNADNIKRNCPSREDCRGKQQVY